MLIFVVVVVVVVVVVLVIFKLILLSFCHSFEFQASCLGCAGFAGFSLVVESIMPR